MPGRWKGIGTTTTGPIRYRRLSPTEESSWPTSSSETCPTNVVAALDASAARQGLSRAEYVRRLLTREAVPERARVTRADLEWFAETFSDLEDPAVMDTMWR